MQTALASGVLQRTPLLSRALLLAFLAGLLVAFNPAFSWANHKLSAPQAHESVKAGRLVLIDVRSPREWKQTGVPQGAKLITIHHPSGAKGFLEGILKAAGGDKSRPIALICAQGVRSSRGKRFLERQGFTNVHDVSEGMLGRRNQPGWLARKLPIRKYAP